MAKEIDLESQEQIDALKQFWEKYGNLITVVVVLAALAFWGLNYYKKHQFEQATKASVVYGQMQLAADAKDTAKVGQLFVDIQSRFGSTTYAQQAGFVAAQAYTRNKQWSEADAALQWVYDHSEHPDYKATAQLYQAGVAVDQGDLDKALNKVGGTFPGAYQALADDRRGDILLLQEKQADAVAAYKKAYDAMDEDLLYRNVVEAKLTRLGAAPESTAESDAKESANGA